MNDAAPQGLVPPRPNLGPEPWHDPLPLSRVLPVFLILVFVLLVPVLWRRHRRSAARTRQDQHAAGGLADSNPTPRDRLVSLSASIREALTVPFGTACRAMTTEELATDGRLEELLGDRDLRELIRFLDQVDRLKFAPERSHHQQEALEEALATWEPCVETLRARIRARPRDRTKRGGLPKRSASQGVKP